MRKIILLLTISLFVFGLSITMYAKNGKGKVASVKGKVYIMEYTKKYKQAPLTVGKTVLPNDIILTKGNGIARIRLADGSNVVIRQNSRVKFSMVSSKSQRVHVGKGGILTKVSKLQNKKRGFRVNSPTGVAGVRGTKFTVEYDEKTKRNDVNIYEGNVNYQQDNKLGKRTVYKLKRGDAVAVSRSSNITIKSSDPKTLRKYEELMEELAGNISGWEFN